MRHDLRQLTEVVRGYNFTPTTFAEIGSRDGHDTAFVANYWNILPDNCYIFEAHPVCHTLISRTYPQFNLFHTAITDIQGVVEFNAGIVGYETNVGISSLLDMEQGSFISEKVEVDGWRMDGILEYLGIPSYDLVKIDVEGASLQVLEGFGEYLQDVKFIQIELETKRVWKEQALHSEIVDYLHTKGFSVVDDVILSHDQNDTLFKNNKHVTYNP